jgi:hypothetical protein
MDELQIHPQETTTHKTTNDKPTSTPVLEQIRPSSPSPNKDGEASNLVEGYTEMDVDEHNLTGIDLEHLDQAYHK